MGKINFKDLSSEKPSVKYCCAKECIRVSAADPGKIFPQLDLFAGFLDGENHVMKWTATKVIGNMAAADKKNKIDAYIPVFIKMLGCGEMITAANAIGALAVIAKNKPCQRERILTELLEVENGEFYNKGSISPECKNIAIGHVITAFEGFKDELARDNRVKKFLKKQAGNSRNAVKKKAEKLFLKLIKKTR